MSPRYEGNPSGAVLTAVAGIVLLASKFTEGAWLLVILVPGLMLLFDRIERYYRRAENNWAWGGYHLNRCAVPTRRPW